MIKRNIVNTNDINNALVSIINNTTQTITVDANFFIPPDRSKELRNLPAFSYEKFRDIWILPLINTFSNIAIHEAVYNEIFGAPRNLIDSLLQPTSRRLELLTDSALSELEKIIRNSIEMKIAPNTAYNPHINNKDDRGEVKSLAYIATKGLLYFCSHDNNAISLIDNADKLDTGLQGVYAVRTYEILYLILKLSDTDSCGLRALYKYLYFLTQRDKDCNPCWAEYIQQMDILYRDSIDKFIQA